MSTAGNNWISPAGQMMPARLPYDKDQYSPLNPSGQRKYSNSFMNALRDFMDLEERPEQDDNQVKLSPTTETTEKPSGSKPKSLQLDEKVKVNDKRGSLPYAPDQYSPTNPNGKRKYSNEFLKAVCRSMLEELNGGKEGRSKSESLSNHLKYDDDQQYRPSTKSGHRRYSCRFLKAIGSAITSDTDHEDLSSLLKDRSLFPWDFGNYNKVSLQSQDVFCPKFNQEDLEPIQLKGVDNPWRPELADEKKRDISYGVLRPDRLVKMFRGYLNKLTPENSDIIIDQIANLPLDTNDAMNLANLLFEKAVSEPKYCQVYADVCSHVMQIQELVVAKCFDIMNWQDPYEGLSIEARREEILQETKTSKKLLLAESLYELMRQRRARHLGAIKLVGELYKLNVLKLDTILKYIVKFTDTATNESIEFLCNLLCSVGYELATKPALEEFLETLMKTLRLYSGDKVIGVNLDARVKFKVLDTIEMSENNWRPRVSEEEPKKISEIRREFASTQSSGTSTSAYQMPTFDDSIELIRMLEL